METDIRNIDHSPNQDYTPVWWTQEEIDRLMELDEKLHNQQINETTFKQG